MQFAHLFLLLPALSWSTNADITGIATKHMQLARVFNGMYLQMNLMDGSIDSNDVVAGVYNLDSKNTFQQLGNVVDVKKQIELLKTTINTVSANLMTSTELTEVDNGLNSVERVKTNLQTIANGANYLNLPEFVSDDSNAIELVDFTGNAVGKMLENIRLFETVEFSRLAYIVPQLQDSLRGSSYFLRDFTSWRVQNYTKLDFDVKTLAPLRKSLYAVELLQAISTNLNSLSTNLNKLNSNTDKITPFLDTKVINHELLNKIGILKRNLQQLSVISQERAIAPAFGDNHEISELHDDVKSQWLEQLFSESDKMQQLLSALDISKQFHMATDSLKGNIALLKSVDSIKHLEQAETVVTSALNIQSSSSHIANSIQKFQTPCLAFTIPAKPTSYGELGKFLKLLHRLPTDLEKATRGMKQFYDLKSMSSKLLYLATEIINAKTEPAFEALKLSNLLSDVKNFTTRWSEVAENCVIDAAITSILEDPTELRKWITEVQTWMKTITVVDQCSITEDEISPLVHFNNFIANLEKAKSNGLIDKVEGIQTEISQVMNSVLSLNTTLATAIQTSTSKVEFDKLKPLSEDLLSIAAGITSFSHLSQLKNSKAHLHLIENSPNLIQYAIDNTDDPAVKVEVKSVWDNLPALKTQLSEVESKLEQLESALQVTEETDLEMLSAVYQEAAKVGFSGKLDMRKFSSSLKLLPPGSVDNLITAFDSIKAPLFIDLDLAHASFQQMPQALSQVKNTMASKSTPGTSRNTAALSGNEEGAKIADNDTSIGLIVGVCIAILVVIVLVAAGIYFYLKREKGNGAKDAKADEKSTSSHSDSDNKDKVSKV